ncbi:MAG: 2-hydroxyacid dehydrogenase, partial [Burkholderiaceae bacterium]
MASPSVLILDPLHTETQAALEKRFPCIRLFDAGDKPALLSSLADSVQVVATHSAYGISNHELDALPRLKLVCNFGVGIDTINVPDCTARGVRVCNTP